MIALGRKLMRGTVQPMIGYNNENAVCKRFSESKSEREVTVSMKIKKIFLLFALSIVAVALIGCSKDSKLSSSAGSGGDMRVAINAQPPTLDSHMSTSTATRDVARHIYEGLVTINSKYQVVPMLAESFEQSADGKTYTFKLRKGVKFHNGKEMTADDVMASIDRWRDKVAEAKKIFTDAKVEAKDAGTIVVQLPTPSIGFLSSLTQSQFMIMPREVMAAADAKGVKEYIGTGPFKYVDWKQDQYIHLTKYSDYSASSLPADGPSGKKEALVDNLYLDIVLDGATRLAGVQTGQYQIALSLPSDSYQQVKSDKNLQPQVTLNAIFAVVFNKKQGLFANPKMREAVNAALDADSIMRAAFAEPEFYRVNPSYMFKEQADWYSEAGKENFNKKDIAKAKRLLTEAGYKGEEIRLLSTRDYSYYYNGSVVIKEQLEKIGMKVKLDIFDWPTVTSMRDDPAKWDLLMAGSSPVTNPSQLLMLSPSWAGWTNDAKIEAGLKNIASSVTVADAKKIWNDVQAQVWSYLPAVKFGDGYLLAATSKKVEGYQFVNGPIFWNTKVKK